MIISTIIILSEENNRRHYDAGCFLKHSLLFWTVLHTRAISSLQSNAAALTQHRWKAGTADGNEAQLNLWNILQLHIVLPNAGVLTYFLSPRAQFASVPEMGTDRPLL